MPELETRLRCLLVPLADRLWLVPSAVVAEVTGAAQLSQVPGAPHWLLGEFSWRRQALPVISVEAIGGAERRRGLRNKVVVLYSLKRMVDLPYYGVQTAGNPRVFRATSETVATREVAVPRGHRSLQGVMIDGKEDAWIPDLEGIEDLICRYYSAATRDPTTRPDTAARITT